MNKYKTNIHLTVLGPFLTASITPESYGLQTSFHRDHTGKPVISGSHIKGKVRMAFRELERMNLPGFSLNLKQWLGEASANGGFEPASGEWFFSDFVCPYIIAKRKRTRVTINPQSMTANESQLRDIEDIFPSGSSIVWQGYISFLANDEANAEKICQYIRIGFMWLTTLGAEKGVGFGRLKTVSVSHPHVQVPTSVNPTVFENEQSLHLRIRPRKYLIVGGVKKPKANFVRSERIIPGSVIKGALANSLNRAFGITPSHRPLSTHTAIQMPGYEDLAIHYNKIRVTHAIPTYVDQNRPVKMPVTMVEVENKRYDVALEDDPGHLIQDKAPLYFIDWKIPQEYFDAADPKEVFVTRTAIDDETRRSDESQLFTYSYLCAVDSEGKQVDWVCNVDFSSITDQNIRARVIKQFVMATTTYLDRLGKLNQEVEITVHQKSSISSAPQKLIRDNLIIITLQTDTLMLDPEAVRQLEPGEDLFSLYSAYWSEISTFNGAEPCLKLQNFYAHQTFKGGYLYHRYAGAGAPAQQHDHYYPYYLTGAGSVFILHPVDENAAQRCLERWLSQGLCIPSWANQRFSRPGRSLWQTCPFVPENGFGEIIVNLDCHWEKRS